MNTFSSENGRFRNLVKMMKGTEPTSDAGQYIYFSAPRFRYSDIWVEVFLCSIQELFHEGNLETKAWTLSAPKDVVGHLIADTELTQKYIYDVLARILNKLFAPDLDEENLELHNKVYYLIDDNKIPPLDEAERLLYQDAWDRRFTFDDYCLQKEIDKLRSQLHAEN